MKEKTLNSNDLKIANQLAYVYRNPEAVDFDRKAQLYAIASINTAIHYKALEINKNKYKKMKSI